MAFVPSLWIRRPKRPFLGPALISPSIYHADSSKQTKAIPTPHFRTKIETAAIARSRLFSDTVAKPSSFGQRRSTCVRARETIHFRWPLPAAPSPTSRGSRWRHIPFIIPADRAAAHTNEVNAHTSHASSVDFLRSLGLCVCRFCSKGFQVWDLGSIGSYFDQLMIG